MIFKKEINTMSEEIKNNELTDEELEQVNGGFFDGPTAVKLPGSSNSWV